MRVFITGTTSGIGYETAKTLVREGHEVIIGCRNLDKAEDIRKELVELNEGASVTVEYIDMSDIESIDKCVENLYKNYDYIDILINNAGVFVDKHSFNKSGYELTYAINYLGLYHLTEKLLDLLKVKENSLIINLSSKAGLYGKLRFKDDFFKKQPSGFKAYSGSKLAVLLYAKYLSGRLKDSTIKVVTVHPGKIASGIWKGDSLIMKIIGPISMKKYDSPEEGSKVIKDVMSCDFDTLENGGFYEKGVNVIDYSSKVDDGIVEGLIELT